MVLTMVVMEDKLVLLLIEGVFTLSLMMLILDTRDNTINTAAAVGNSTPRNTVYIFLLHYNCYMYCISSCINCIC